MSSGSESLSAPPVISMIGVVMLDRAYGGGTGEPTYASWLHVGIPPA
jgi:hypothetical protein